MSLALAIHNEGAKVVAFDPTIEKLPPELAEQIELAPSAEKAVSCANAVVIATPYPEFPQMEWSTLVSSMATPVVIDANRVLASALNG